MDNLVEDNLNLVRSIIQKMNVRGNEADDAFQEGVLGLINAAEKYDKDYGVKFGTYAYPAIYRRIRRMLNSESKKISTIPNDFLSNISEEPKTKIELEDFNLTEREKTVYRLKAKGFSNKEISADIGVNYNEVTNILNRIKKKIRLCEKDYFG